MTEKLTLDISNLSPAQVAEILHYVRALDHDNEKEAVPNINWENAESTGWSSAHVDTLRARLAERGNMVQLAAFDAAINNGGFVSRQELYELGKYSTERKLNNWTSPFKTITAELIAESGLPEDACPAMDPYYGKGTSFRPAKGFIVAPEIVRLRQEKKSLGQTEGEP